MSNPIQRSGDLMKIDYTEVTDRGKVRQTNEDAFAHWSGESGSLFVLADGLGGLADGEIASQLAVSVFLKQFRSSIERLADRLSHAMFAANQAIWQENTQRVEPMATTLTASFFSENSVHVAHVGDSRLYRVRGHGAAALTRDHSISRHILTKALGLEERVDPDLFREQVEAGDCFVQCSDGLHSMIPDEEIARHARTPDSLEAASKLIAASCDAGGLDNVTVQVVRILEI